MDPEIETQGLIEALNNDLVGWSDIYNALRGNADFERRADFLWTQVFEGIYRQKMPRNASLAIEVTAEASNRLQSEYGRNMETVDDGPNRRHFLIVNPPLDVPLNDQRHAGRLELVHTGGPTDHRFGLNSYSETGGISTSPSVLTPREIVGFKIRPRPSNIVTPVI